ncbi:MAG: copper chaperone PCu(A)C [Candidatus Nanopelagicales bacterium]
MKGSRYGVAVAVVVLGLAGCGGDGGSANVAVGSCAHLEITDAWVKATTEGMTAAFATMRNPDKVDVVITGATTPAAGMVELHQTVRSDGEATMQQMADGLTVGAGQSVTLAPGGDHLMLMELPKPIAAGDEVQVELQCTSGVQEFTALAKTYTGAQEDYSPSPAAS